MVEKIIVVALANLIPTTEQLGAIPLGIALGLDPVTVLVISIIMNSLLFFPTYFGLKIFYSRILSRIKLLRKYMERVRKIGKPYVEKYGVFGVTLFISIPSPFTGTFTGSMLCWLMNLNWKKSFISIFLGSFIGGVIILLGTLGLVDIINFLF